MNNAISDKKNADCCRLGSSHALESGSIAAACRSGDQVPAGSKNVALASNGATVTASGQEVAGKWGPDQTIDGDRLAIEAGPTHSNKSAMRSYLAVRGGINAKQIGGSRSTDTLSRIGPKVVAANDKIAVLCATRGVFDLLNDTWSETRQGKQGTKQSTSHNVTLRFIPGPRDDFFTEASIEQFQAQTWTMSHN